MNNVVLMGNLARDPDYRESGNGVCRLVVAVTDGYGEKETTSYPTVVVFGKTAQNCAKYLAKGRKVAVSGRIQTGSYEKNGQKIYTTDVVANRVEFLSSPTDTIASAEKPVRNEFEAPQGYAALEYDDVPF